MPSLTCCPEPGVLEQFLRGAMSEKEVERIGEHLLQCRQCVSTLQSLPNRDPVIEALRGSSDQPDSPRMSALIHRFLQLAQGPAQPREGAHSQSTVDSAPSGIDSGADRRDAMDAAIHDVLAPAQQPDELGRLGPYRVLRVLGRGGMGVVFLAEDPQLQRQVALKAMRPHLAGGPLAGSRFLREARATAAIKHDHIVTIYQVGEERGVPFLAMELLEGESLADCLEREQKLPLPEVLRIGRETALALAAAHERGLIHRDIKPANMWLDQGSRRVKILDFGLARAVNDAAHLTAQGAIIGTPAFMAPEQARGDTVDARCDLFSLGCVLYRLCTGRPAFRGKDIVSTLMAVATEQPPAPRQVAVDVPRSLSDLVMQLLAKDPNDRPSSAAAVAVALRGLERSQESKPPRRRLWPLVAAVLALLLVGGTVPLGLLITIATPKGRLVIETDDPTVEVVVKGGGATIHTRDRVLDLKVGDYVIELTDPKDGLKLSTDRFTINRDGKPVTVWLEKPGAASKPGTPSTGLPILAPLDALDPAKIPAAERLAWHPKELVAVLGEHRRRHLDGVHAVAVSANGHTAVSGGVDGYLHWYDVRTFEEKGVLDLGFSTHGAALSPDGKLVAVGHATPKDALQLWDMTGERPRLRQTLVLDDVAAGNRLVLLAFSHDGNRLVGCTMAGTLRLWDVKGDKLQEWGTIPKHLAESFSPDDRTLAVASVEDQRIRLYDLTGDAPKERLVLPDKEGFARRHQNWPSWLALPRFLPDGRLVSIDPERNLRVWDVSQEKPKMVGSGAGACAVTWGVGDGPSVLLMEPLNQSRENVDAQVWDLPPTGPRLRCALKLPWARHDEAPVVAVLAPNGRTALVGTAFGAVHIWNVEDKAAKLVDPLQPQPLTHNGSITWMGMSLTGEQFVATREDGRIGLWTLNHPVPEVQNLKDTESQLYLADSVSPDGRWMVGHPHPRSVDLWQIEDGGARKISSFSTPWINSAAFTPDSKSLYVASGGRLTLYDVQPSLRERLSWSFGYLPFDLRVLSEGKQLIGLNTDGNPFCWTRLEDGSLRPDHVGRGFALAVTPDGKLFAVPGEGNLELGDLTGPRPQRLTPLEYPADLRPVRRTSALALTPDGRTLAAFAADAAKRQLVVWDVPSGRVTHSWDMETISIAMHFTSEGRHLIMANANGTIYVLRLAPPPAGTPIR